MRLEQTVSELGRLDTLVNNAGVMLLGPVVGAPVEEWERMVQINLLGLLYCTHAALPHLLRAAEDGPRAGERPGEHQLGRGPRDPQRERRLQRDQARSRGIQRCAAQGDHHPSRPRFPRGTGRDRDGALVAQPARSAQRHPAAVRPDRAPHAEDIADAIAYIVSRPRHVAINEVLVRPTEQE